MVWQYWAGGAAAVGLLGLAVYKGASGNKQSSDSADAAPVTGTPLAAPLFMASGGGTSQNATNDSVLGGATWEPPKVPLSENPDIAIAKINADVNMAAIAAGKDVQMAGIKTAGDVKQTVTPIVPPIVTPPPITTPPPNTTDNKTEFRGNDTSVGAMYINNLLKTQPGASSQSIEDQIYGAARAQNFSATEVAQAINQASGKNITPAQVNQWIKDRGLAPL